MSLKRGEIIMHCQPHVHVLCRKERGKRCDACFGAPEKLLRCTNCQLTRYCDTNCQKKDWFLHKEECKCLTQVKPKIPTDSVRVLLRIIIRHKKEDPNKHIEGDPGLRTFSDFESHKREIESDKERSSNFIEMCLTLKELTHKSLELPPPSELFDIYGKMMINTFTICDGEMNEIGTGIYISASKLDHRCNPNAVVTFRGADLYVRALEDIENSSIDNVYISYIDQLSTSAERKKQLQDQYYFECTCDRCKDEELDGLMLSIKCSVLNCPGVVSTNTDGIKINSCRLCTTEVPLKMIEKAHEVEEYSIGKLKQIEKMKKDSASANEILNFCEECSDQQKNFSMYNVYRLKILDEAFDACIDLEYWEKALGYGELTIEPYQKLLPSYSVNVGIQLLKVGKLQLYLQKLEQALKTLQQAENIIIVTHGRSHEIHNTVTKLIDQCIEELRVQHEKHLSKNS